MWEWITNIIAIWPTIFANAAVDYLTDYFIRPMFGGGTLGHYFTNGLQFTAKSATTDTSYFHAGTGSVFGSITGMFAPNTQGVTATPNR